MIKKEIMIGLRNYKFFIIAFVCIFFALLDPIMLKFLPSISGMEQIAEIIVINKDEAIKSYIGDVFQILPVVLAFTLSGLVSKEFTNHYIDIPLSKGIDIKKLFTLKFLVYGRAISIIILMSVSINNYYSAMIFDEKGLRMLEILRIVLMVSLMMIYYLSIHMLVELFISKAYLSSIISIGIFFGQYWLIRYIDESYRYLMPHYLALEVADLYKNFVYEDIVCFLSTFSISLFLIFLGRRIINKKSVY